MNIRSVVRIGEDRVGLMSSEDDDIVLINTSYKASWYRFQVTAGILWLFLLGLSTWTLVLRIKQQREIRAQRGRRETNDRGSPVKIILAINSAIAFLRVIFFVDPRGWEGFYPVVVYELLLRIGFCLTLAMWLFLILRWWELGNFSRKDSLRLALRGSERSWKRALTLASCITLFVTTATILETSVDKADTQPKASFVVLGIVTAMFLVFGLYAGYRALFCLRDLALNRRTMTASTLTLSERVNEGKMWQILYSMLAATPCAVALIGVSLWSGRNTDAETFFAYLVVRHTVELCLSSVIFFAIQQDPAFLRTIGRPNLSMIQLPSNAASNIAGITASAWRPEPNLSAKLSPMDPVRSVVNPAARTSSLPLDPRQPQSRSTASHSLPPNLTCPEDVVDKVQSQTETTGEKVRISRATSHVRLEEVEDIGSIRPMPSLSISQTHITTHTSHPEYTGYVNSLPPERKST